VSLARLVQRMPLRHFHATHYHADYVSPWWATTLTPVATIGRHHFYQ
jgi:spore germination cell wall hydrolase CwlJ-like protein